MLQLDQWQKGDSKRRVKKAVQTSTHQDIRANRWLSGTIFGCMHMNKPMKHTQVKEDTAPCNNKPASRASRQKTPKASLCAMPWTCRSRANCSDKHGVPKALWLFNFGILPYMFHRLNSQETQGPTAHTGPIELFRRCSLAFDATMITVSPLSALKGPFGFCFSPISMLTS